MVIMERVKNRQIIAVLCCIIVFLVGLVLSLNYKLKPVIPEDFPYKVVINEDNNEVVIYTNISAISSDKDGNLIVKGGEK